MSVREWTRDAIENGDTPTFLLGMTIKLSVEFGIPLVIGYLLGPVVTFFPFVNDAAAILGAPAAISARGAVAFLAIVSFRDKYIST